MKIILELERLESGDVKATMSDPSDATGAWAVKGNIISALTAIAPREEDLPPLGERPTLDLLEDVVVPSRTSVTRKVATADTANIMELLSGALADEQNVCVTYEDRAGNITHDRILTPLEFDWGTGMGGMTPSRTMKAIDNGIRKTFYVNRIKRAEIV